jgi:hypothetical protein
MRNLRLTFGSVFGLIVGGGAAAAILYLLSPNGNFPPRGIRIVLFAAMGGAALGNWIWSLASPPPPPDVQ